MDSEGQALAYESLLIGKVSRVLELSDELQNVIFHPNQTILDRIVLGAAELLEAESCGFFLKSDASLFLKADHSMKYGFNFEPVTVRIESIPGGGLTGHIAADGKIVNLHGAALREHKYRRKNAPPATHLISGICESLLAIPLKDRKGRLLGLLTAHNKKQATADAGTGGPPFAETDVAIGRLLAGRIVPVLETHRLIRAFRDITQQVYAARGLREVLDGIAEQAQELLAADTCQVSVPDYIHGNPSFQVCVGALPDAVFASEISAPLGVRGPDFGEITAKSSRPDAFDQQDWAILQLLAEQASAAIETVQREEHFRTTVKEASRSAAVPEEILDRILKGASHFGFDAGLMYIADHGNQKLRLLTTFGCEKQPDVLKDFSHTFDSKSFAAKVFRAKSSQYSHEPSHDPDVDQKGLQTFHINSSLIGTPMLYQSEPVGVLVCWTTERESIPESNKDVLDHYASMAGQLIGMAQIEEQRSQDLREIIGILESMHAEPSVAHHMPLILDCLRKRYFDRVRYYTWSEATSEFVGIYSVGMEPIRFSGHRIALTDSQHARDIYERALDSSAAQEYQPGVPELDTQAGPLAKKPDLPFVTVSLVGNRKIYGAIVADNTPTCRKIAPEALKFMTHMGAVASQLIANATNHEIFIVETFHMIRAPAHSLQGLLDTLGTSGLDGSEREKLLQDARDEAHRLAQLAKKLANIFGSRVVRSKASLRELVKVAVQRFKPKAQEAGVALLEDLDESESYPVVVDREKILVVLDTLLENAIAFSNPGQTIKVALVAETRRYHVCVADEGPGVPPDWKQRIFKVGESRPPEGKLAGAGVGLPIARGIIEAHGGKLELLTPLPGEGARFYFTLNQSTENVDEKGEG